MTSNDAGIDRILRRRYILALSIIACLVIVSQLAVQYSISKNEDDSRIINIAGRQRMLSQRITKCVLGMYMTEDAAKKADLLAKLIKAIKLWEVSHKGLQHGDTKMGLPGNNSPEVKALFAAIQQRHLIILGAAKSIAALAARGTSGKELMKREIEKISDNEGEFLKGMDTIVFQYDSEAKAKVKTVKQIEIWLAIITLFVLAMEAFFIFRPAELQIKAKIRKIRENEESINRIFETAPIAMFLVDRESFSIIRLNHLAAHLFDVDMEWAVGQSLSSCWNGRLERNRELFDRMRRERVMDGEETEVQINEQRKRALLVSSSHMSFCGKPAIIVGLSEVTKQKELEQQLRQAQKIEALGQLAGGIAHDFNNLLTAVIGNVSLVKMLATQGSAKIAERLTAAETAANRAKELTQRLLTFSRGGAPVRGPVSLEGLAREAATLALSGSSAVCEYVIPDELWPVYADEGQIGQVVGNLVINAHQAMSEGGRIRISCENVPDTSSGRFVRMSISDEGIGIPPENMERIFDPFFTTKEKGRGLGLATTYSIIRNHEGVIRVDSEKGRGAIFTFTLPAAESAVAPSSIEKDRFFRGTGRVLVMDDEEIIRETARVMLEAIGYSVEEAKDGVEAIALYEMALNSGAPFGAVIMDLTIPGGMGGKEAVRRLVEIDPQARVIVSSGYSNDPIMANFREYGFTEVVSKPYNIGELSRKLAGVMDMPA